MFVYLSFSDGRVYSIEKNESTNIQFDDTNNKITYSWKGPWEGKTKTYDRKILFKINLVNASEYNKIKIMFN